MINNSLGSRLASVGMADIPWEAVAAGVIALLGALTAYLNAKRNGAAAQAVALGKDNEFQAEAIKDLALFGAKAYAANADGEVTQDEYDDLMQEGKALAVKYGDKFGVGEQVRTILSSFKVG